MEVFGVTARKMVYLGQSNSDASAVLATPRGVSHEEVAPVTTPQSTPLRPCAASECDRPAWKHADYCRMHYDRLYRRGSLDPIRHPAPPDLPGEEWRAVVGYEGYYAVSNLGRLRRVASFPAHYTGQLVSGQDNGTGYLHVCLGRDGAKRYRYLHRLVAEAFIGPCPSGMEVNHKDLNRQNCRLDNLEYLTKAQNVRHSVASQAEKWQQTGAVRAGKSRKLTAGDVRTIRASTEAAVVLAKRFSVDPSTIRQIRQRRVWKHVP
jgi:hypothetical protein